MRVNTKVNLLGTYAVRAGEDGKRPVLIEARGELNWSGGQSADCDVDQGIVQTEVSSSGSVKPNLKGSVGISRCEPVFMQRFGRHGEVELSKDALLDESCDVHP